MQWRYYLAGLGVAAWACTSQVRQPVLPVVGFVDMATATPILRPLAGVTLSLQLAQGAPDRLVVTRTKNNLNNPGAPAFSKTIADREKVEKLYEDILDLPPLRAGRLNCPRDVGIRYSLDFYAGTASILAGDYDPTGCATINLGDGTIKSDSGGSFAADFRQALGFASERQFLGFQ